MHKECSDNLLCECTLYTLIVYNKGEESTLSVEDRYQNWLADRFEEGVRKVVEMIQHRRPSVSNLAVATVMNLIQCQNWANNKTKEKGTYPPEAITHRLKPI